MRVRDIMSAPVVTVTPQTTIRDAASLFRTHEIGALPVLDGDRIVGIVTDRDLVCGISEVTQGGGVRPMSDVMTPDPVFCRDDQKVEDAAALMGDEQVRRLVVLDADSRLAGIISVGDIALNASEELAGQILGEVCEIHAVPRRKPSVRPAG